MECITQWTTEQKREKKVGKLMSVRWAFWIEDKMRKKKKTINENKTLKATPNTQMKDEKKNASLFQPVFMWCTFKYSHQI